MNTTEHQAYPLSWPTGFERTRKEDQSWSKFGSHNRSSGVKVTVAEGLTRVQSQLSSFSRRGYSARIRDVVVSTNIELRRDGQPYSNRGEPSDSGVAVYFSLDGKPTVLCCDKWQKVGENLAAIAKTLEAMRGLERWGVTESERVFTGFAALPAPGEAQARTCWVVLGIAPTDDLEAIKKAWRQKATTAHPDAEGGSHDAMAEVNTARDQAVIYEEAKN